MKDKILGAETCNFIKKETLAQVFSCEFCEISKSNFSYRAPPVVASVMYILKALTEHLWATASDVIAKICNKIWPLC